MPYNLSVFHGLCLCSLCASRAGALQLLDDLLIIIASPCRAIRAAVDGPAVGVLPSSESAWSITAEGFVFCLSECSCYPAERKSLDDGVLWEAEGCRLSGVQQHLTVACFHRRMAANIVHAVTRLVNTILHPCTSMWAPAIRST